MNMKNIVAVIPMILLFTGCASTPGIATDADAELRVTEYGAKAGGFTQNRRIGGCRVVQKGHVSVYMKYEGRRCRVSTEPSPMRSTHSM